jgi:hypothetical protein
MTTEPTTPTRREGAHRSGLSWFEVHFPHELSAAELIKGLQPLAYRPRLGWRRRTPIVVFELRARADTVRWLIGIDQELSGEFPHQLRAQLPGLVLTPLTQPSRPTSLLIADVRPVGLAQPLRMTMAANVTAGLLEVMGALAKDESAVVQWVIGPAQSRRSRPDEFNVARALGFRAVATETADNRRQWRQKATEPLFAVRGRIGARAPNPDQARAIVRLLGEALQLTSDAHAELRVSRPSAARAHQLDQVATTGTTAADLVRLFGMSRFVVVGSPARLVGCSG